MSTMGKPDYDDPLERAQWANAGIEAIEREAAQTGKSFSEVTEAYVWYYREFWQVDTSDLDAIIPDLQEAIRYGEGLDLQKQRVAEELNKISKEIQERE